MVGVPVEFNSTGGRVLVRHLRWQETPHRLGHFSDRVLDHRVYLHLTMTELVKVPIGFNPTLCRTLLTTRDRSLLMNSFNWSDTPEGAKHWCDIYSGLKGLSDSDISRIEGWIALSVFG